MPPKDPDLTPDAAPRIKARRSKAVRRLVIWYRRNAAVTTLVDTATTSANAAGNVAGSVTSMAGTVVNSAGSMAGSVLQPVMDPLRRLQGGVPGEELEINDRDRVWVAVDGMGGDNAPVPILEGCLQAIERLAVKIRFVGETDRAVSYTHLRAHET